MVDINDSFPIGGFDENYAAQFDAVDSKSVDFPMEEIIDKLDNIDREAQEHRQKMAAGLLDLLSFLAEPALNKEKISETDLKLTAERVIAALWVLKPQLFDGISGRELSRRLGGCHATISCHAARFSARYGIVNRGQSHGRNGAHARQLHPSESADRTNVLRGTLSQEEEEESNG